MKIPWHLIILMVLFVTGCAGSIREVITCTPPQADIYWGRTPSELKRAGYKTPHSRSISGSSWENWCYQVKKDGYHDSEVICKQKDKYRNLDFYLTPIETTITSEPAGATIYWGPSEDQLAETMYVTPQTITIKEDASGASWKDWYYKLKKKGYVDSETVFLPRQSTDRYLHLELKPELKSHHVDDYVVSGRQVDLTWEDHSTDELGFKIERKVGSNGAYRQIATVGANVTSYTDTGLSPATTYYYRVRAYNSQGDSAYCEEIRVKISAR